MNIPRLPADGCAVRAGGPIARLVLSALLAGASLPAAGQAEFPVSFDASAVVLTDPERAQLDTHLQEAGRRWAALLRLDGARSIEIEVVVSEAIPRATGSSVDSALLADDGSREVFEQGAAHELRTGVDPNGALPDVRVTLNPTYLRQELWFDPEPAQRLAPVPKLRTDALSVLLHELGHALAYNGWADGQGNPPAGYWSSFDRWMLGGAPPLFDGPHVLLQQGSRPDLTSGNVHHWANGEAGAPKSRAWRMPSWSHGAPRPQAACEGMASAPVPAPGAALKGNLPAGLMYELMNGVVFYRGSRYDISPLDRAALRDAGLPVDPDPIFAGGFEG